MPHLSPMNWIFMLLSITLIMLMFMSNYWWNSNMKFNQPKMMSSSTKSKWNW